MPEGQMRDNASLFGFRLDGESWLQRVRQAASDPPMGTLGPFELLAEIGRGGQGVVFRAYDPRSRRVVALKRVSAGVFATPEMRARFEREIEAAAGLEHPNIVTVYGAETVDSQVVLVMRWVDGVPFDRWARPPGGPRRSIREILAVFTSVCGAVQHAHLRGVIHRDLKPSNILVDAEDRPWVLDFGLAKLRSGVDSASSGTLTNDFVGTPVYAAPERVRGDRDIDLRSDVYALGVVLYESLAGKRPFDFVDNLPRLLDEIQSVTPPRPSRLNPQVPRELDAIVEKAMAKEPGRRYASAAALGDDIQRFLSGQAVLAHPPSAAYAVRKFVRRHWLAVTTAAAFATVLVMATGVSTHLLFRANADRARAADEETRARVESAKHEAISGFMANLLMKASALESSGRGEVTVRETVDLAAAELEGPQPRFEPEVEAAVRMTLGDAYGSLTRLDLAEMQYQKALRLRRQLFGENHDLVASSLNKLARVYRDMGRLDAAVRMQQEALSVRRALLGPDSLYVAQSLNGLAITLRRLAKFDQSEAMQREALAIYEKGLGLRHENVALASASLAALLIDMGRPDEALAYAQRAMDILDAKNKPSPDGQSARFNLARAYGALGQREEAERTLREILAADELLFPDPHAVTASHKYQLGMWLYEAGRSREADELLASALEAIERLHLQGSTFHADALLARTKTLCDLGQLSQAEATVRACDDIARRIGVDAAARCKARLWLCEVLRLSGRYEEAEDAMMWAWAELQGAPTPPEGRCGYAETLAKLYMDWDAAEPGAGYAELAAQWRDSAPLETGR